LHMAQLMPLPLTVSYFSKIQIGFTFLVPAHLGSPGKKAVKRVCVYVPTTSESRTGSVEIDQRRRPSCLEVTPPRFAASRGAAVNHTDDESSCSEAVVNSTSC